MRVTQRVRRILQNYESDNPGTKTNLARILMAGKLGGTGKMIILPVDQGFEHGPARSFAPNPVAYDPHYLFRLAVEAGLNAYAAPLGCAGGRADSYAGAVPLILKMNSANTLPASVQDQAVTASVEDALRLGCCAVGFTIYPGVDATYDMYEEVRDMIAEAKACGLASVVWAYPRGAMSKDGETAIDVVGYSAHMACLLGAHIVKVKLPTDHLEQAEAKKVYQSQKIAIKTQAQRVAHIVECCFAGRRIVVFSGGAAKGADAVFQDARDIRDGGGNGSIIGRNSFQRSYDDARALLDRLIRIYQGRE
ncbi:MAG: class I fructose-bisphosphate aldolase [Alphaproteobacteria bacterium]